MSRSFSTLKKQLNGRFLLITCGMSLIGQTVRIDKCIGTDKFWLRNGNSLPILAGNTLNEAIIMYNNLVIPDDQFDITRSINEQETELDITEVSSALDSAVSFANELIEAVKDWKVSIPEAINLIPNGVEIIKDIPQLRIAYSSFLKMTMEQKINVVKNIFLEIDALEKHHHIIDNAFEVIEAVAQVIAVLQKK